MARWLVVLAVVFTLFANMPAQTVATADDQKAKEKLEKQTAIADAILTDVTGLALSENRAYAYAKLGGMSWKTDRKTAASMFQRAVGEIADAQSMAESEAKIRPAAAQIEFRISQSIRPSILTAIAAFDAEFALDSMFRTRNAMIQRALTQATMPAGKVSELSNSGPAIVRNELNLEQRLTRLAAEQNPERAIKMLQESIKKGVSTETLSMLKKLFEKDPESANSLADDTLDKLQSASFSGDPADADNVSLSTMILADFIRPKKKPGTKELKFDEAQLRSLAQKLVDFTLTQDPRFGMQRFAQVIAIAEKFSPGSVKALKKIQKSSMPRAFQAMDPAVRGLIDGKTSPGQMVADAEKLSADLRPLVYQGAANKMAQKGDLTGAADLLNSNFSGQALENATNTINAAYANYLIGQGKFEEADKFIGDFPETARRQAYLNLATRAYAKNPGENLVFAVGVLRKVRQLMPDRPADSNDLVQFMQLAAACAPIVPDEAFNTLEPLMPQLNAIADAGAVFQGFQGNPGVRSGEFVMGTGGTYGFQFDQPTLRALAKADLDRTLKLIENLQRREIRITLKLQLAESSLN